MLEMGWFALYVYTLGLMIGIWIGRDNHDTRP